MQAKQFSEELAKKKIMPGKGLVNYLQCLSSGASLPTLYWNPERKREGEGKQEGKQEGEEADAPPSKRQRS